MRSDSIFGSNPNCLVTLTAAHRVKTGDSNYCSVSRGRRTSAMHGVYITASEVSRPASERHVEVVGSYTSELDTVDTRLRVQLCTTPLQLGAITVTVRVDATVVPVISFSTRSLVRLLSSVSQNRTRPPSIPFILREDCRVKKDPRRHTLAHCHSSLAPY